MHSMSAWGLLTLGAKPVCFVALERQVKFVEKVLGRTAVARTTLSSLSLGPWLQLAGLTSWNMLMGVNQRRAETMQER